MSKMENKPSVKESMRVLFTERKHLLYMAFLTGFFIGVMVASNKECKENQLKESCHCCEQCEQNK